MTGRVHTLQENNRALKPELSSHEDTGRYRSVTNFIDLLYSRAHVQNLSLNVFQKPLSGQLSEGRYGGDSQSYRNSRKRF